jgi:hypothetical protein
MGADRAHYFVHMKYLILLLLPLCGCAQGRFEKMPADLETDWAKSALPPDLRADATVYLLDPAKGYYVAHQGTNGFVCLIGRTEWEWGEFRNDLFTPIAFDPEGVKTIFPVYRDVAAMRASGKYRPLQVKDTVISRIHRGQYVAPSRNGIAYMLAPLMRVYTGMPGDTMVMSMHMPHYMFYAPYVNNADAGTVYGSDGPFISNPGSTVLGDKKGPFGYYIVRAPSDVSTKLMADGQDLLKRLEAYSPLFYVR